MEKRVNENQKMLDNLEHSLTPFDIQQLTVLKDISKSLAIIADGDQFENDAYVRDKLLIGWFINTYLPFGTPEAPEVVYEKWMKDLGGKLDGE